METDRKKNEKSSKERKGEREREREMRPRRDIEATAIKRKKKGYEIALFSGELEAEQGRRGVQ